MARLLGCHRKIRYRVCDRSEHHLFILMVLINGCSFSTGLALQDPLNAYSMAYCNHHGLPYKNISVNGNSNTNIRSTTISNLLSGNYTFLMVNWTTAWRLTLGNIVPGEVPMTIVPNKVIGDNFNHDRRAADKFDVAGFWELFFDPFYHHQNYFESVFLLQEFCQARNIKYVFTNTNNLIQIPAWKKVSQAVNEGRAHPSTYIECFSGEVKDALSIVYDKIYKNHNMSLIREAFRNITTYVDAINWDRFVGLEKEPLFKWPDPVWPPGSDGWHPGDDAHHYWKNVLNDSEWLTKEINQLKKT